MTRFERTIRACRGRIFAFLCVPLLSLCITKAAHSYNVFPSLVAVPLHKTAIHEQMALASFRCANRSEQQNIDPLSVTCGWPQFRNALPTTSRLSLRPDGPSLEPPNGQTTVRTARLSPVVAGYGKLFKTECKGHVIPTGGLVCKSHYFDLQFLHAMATQRGESADWTQGQILEWLHFVYEGLLDPTLLDRSLKDLLASEDYKRIRPALTPVRFKTFLHRHLSESDEMPNWKGWRLFSFTGTNTFPNEPHQDLRDHPHEFLLGVMLHTIEDSYSAAHNQRGPTETTRPQVTCRPIARFFTYPGQNGDKHAACDRRPSWTAPVDTPTSTIPFGPALGSSPSHERRRRGRECGITSMTTSFRRCSPLAPS